MVFGGAFLLGQQGSSQMSEHGSDVSTSGQYRCSHGGWSDDGSCVAAVWHEELEIKNNMRPWRGRKK